MTEPGRQQNTVALNVVTEYEPRHRARRTLMEWWEEQLLHAPGWALVTLAVGILMVFLSGVGVVVLRVL